MNKKKLMMIMMVLVGKTIEWIKMQNNSPMQTHTFASTGPINAINLSIYSA